MKNPLEFYLVQKAELENETSILKKKLIYLGIVRFLVFIATVFFTYLQFGVYPTVFIIGIFGGIIFTFLVVMFINIKKEKEIVDAKIDINQTEIRVLNRDFHHLDAGLEFINPSHFYSNDIDMFGKGSFFQFINRTKTNDGKIKLANTLTENKIDGILQKQEAIKELSEKVKWRQHFSALASLVTVKNKTIFITKWILSYTSVLPKFLPIIQVVFSIFSLLLIGLVLFGLISFTFITIWFFTGVFITVAFVKKTNNLYLETDKVTETFKQYHQLLNEIENVTFFSKNLIDNQKIKKLHLFLKNSLKF